MPGIGSEEADDGFTVEGERGGKRRRRRRNPWRSLWVVVKGAGGVRLLLLS